MITTEAISPTQKEKLQKKLETALQVSSLKVQRAVPTARAFANISCGINTGTRSTNWALKNSNNNRRQDAPVREFIPALAGKR